MLKDLDIRKSYDSQERDLVNSFYIPTLSESVLYRRTTGFFSSNALALASVGLVALLENGGKMQLITGVEISEEDYHALKTGLENQFVLDSFRSQIDKAEGVHLDHLKLLAWMVSADRLEIKIAVMPESSWGIFHEKVGILEDKEGGKISFSGSINETASGWLTNQEEFKVFRSWIEEENSYLKIDEEKFDRYWNGEVKNFKVINISDAIRDEILKISPKERELPIIKERIKIEYKKLKSSSNSTYDLEELLSSGAKKEPYDYQRDAISCWERNQYHGIVEMATGTGKTIMALGALEKLLSQNEKLLTVIVAPQKHLLEQWGEVIYEQLPNRGYTICNSDNRNWRSELDDKLFNFKNDVEHQIIILTTYSTLSSGDFIDIFQKRYENDNNYFIIADEMHNSGANKANRGLLDEFNIRLGLSATPQRYFDDEGTRLIYDYFGGTVYEYSLKKAIECGKLTPYDYFPLIVYLTTEEYEKYIKLTRQIINASHQDNKEIEERLERLMMRRAEITKKTVNKYMKFQELIEKIEREGNSKYLLIYCQDTEQLEYCQKIINDSHIINHRLTEKESTKKRKQILEEFAKGRYDALVAMNCLDEGIDVPATRTAIIMASTGNPRQYVQRRGRVLRKFEGKDKATIYDFIVLPPEVLQSRLISKVERSIIRKELERVSDFLDTADNKAQIINKLSDVMFKYGVYV